ncbi:MAG: hypothetical protein IIA64_04245 [Planctomycetes bacterium]|nr:hypothetical protein [Planctomycetota bacterium]
MTVCTVSEPAYVRLRTPDHHYFEDEPITILLYPPSADEFDLRVTAANGEEVLRELLTRNLLEMKSCLPIGQSQLCFSTEQVDAFCEVAGELLDKLGYLSADSETVSPSHLRS